MFSSSGGKKGSKNAHSKPSVPSPYGTLPEKDGSSKEKTKPTIASLASWPPQAATAKANTGKATSSGSKSGSGDNPTGGAKATASGTKTGVGDAKEKAHGKKVEAVGAAKDEGKSTKDPAKKKGGQGATKVEGGGKKHDSEKTKTETHGANQKGGKKEQPQSGGTKTNVIGKKVGTTVAKPVGESKANKAIPEGSKEARAKGKHHEKTKSATKATTKDVKAKHDKATDNHALLQQSRKPSGNLNPERHEPSKKEIPEKDNETPPSESTQERGENDKGSSGVQTASAVNDSLDNDTKDTIPKESDHRSDLSESTEVSAADDTSPDAAQGGNENDEVIDSPTSDSAGESIGNLKDDKDSGLDSSDSPSKEQEDGVGNNSDSDSSPRSHHEDESPRSDRSTLLNVKATELLGGTSDAAGGNSSGKESQGAHEGDERDASSSAKEKTSRDGIDTSQNEAASGNLSPPDNELGMSNVDILSNTTDSATVREEHGATDNIDTGGKVEEIKSIGYSDTPRVADLPDKRTPTENDTEPDPVLTGKILPPENNEMTAEHETEASAAAVSETSKSGPPSKDKQDPSSAHENKPTPIPTTFVYSSRPKSPDTKTTSAARPTSTAPKHSSTTTAAPTNSSSSSSSRSSRPVTAASKAPAKDTMKANVRSPPTLIGEDGPSENTKDTFSPKSQSTSSDDDKPNKVNDKAKHSASAKSLHSAKVASSNSDNGGERKGQTSRDNPSTTSSSNKENKPLNSTSKDGHKTGSKVYSEGNGATASNSSSIKPATSSSSSKSEDSGLKKSASASKISSALGKSGESSKTEQTTTSKRAGRDDGPDDGSSLSSGSQSSVVKANTSRVLSLAQRGEWTLLDQTLRGMDKGHVDLNAADEAGVTALMHAVRESRLVIIDRQVDLGADVNVRAKDGKTALHYATTYAKDDVVKLLINRKADPNIRGGAKEQLPLHIAASRPGGVLTMVQVLLKSAVKESRLTQDKHGLIPLLLAAESGNTSVCRELLHSNGAEQVKMHKKGTKDTVLHIACRKKDVDMAKLFVDNGANIDAKNHDGHTPLHVSAWEGDESMIKFLHANKANGNIVDKHDRTALHVAAEKGHTSAVEILVDKCRANVSARTKDGSTLMHIASQYGHPDTTLAFLRKGVPMHMPNKNGAVCLHAAAMQGHVSVIKALLQKGALVDAKTKEGYTALHIAVEHCKPLAVQTLLGYGAQVELKGGKAKETPLHIASRIQGGEKCAEMLVKSGADVNTVQENGETALHIAARHGLLKMCRALLEEGADSTWQSKFGESPLHIAVRHCHWDVADALLTFLANEKIRLDAVMLVNQANAEGETPVHYAAELTKEHGHRDFEDTDMIRLLLQLEGDINMQSKLTHETSLHYCARAGNADVLLEIVKHIGASKTQAAVNKQAKNGWSPLLVASEQGHVDIVKILLKHNARVDVFDEHGKAALHLAAESGHEEVSDVLLWHRAFANAKSKLGVTPLHLAAQNGYNKLVKLLIETHGATIDALSLAKKTPLHMAAQNGQIEVCSTLLKMKADANATDVHGQTPLHLAAENDHSDVVKLFLKYRPELVTMANTNGMTCAHIAAAKGSVAVVKELMRFNKVVVTTARNKTNDSTSLHLAAAGGHAEVVKVLLDTGASATDENADGMTAIHLAAKYGHSNVLEALKDKVSWKVTSTKTGFNALHVAAHYGQMDFVREMLSKVPATVRSEAPHSGDVALKEMGPEYGLTPLHLAAQSGHEGLVRMLLNSPGVQADAATSIHGSTALHLAAQSGHTAVVSLLLSKSTQQLHLKDKRGRTGLHLAAANGHLDMTALLIGQGADIDVYDKNGWTPLHFASRAGHLPVVKLLTEAGASPQHETKDGKVAICYCTANSHAETLSYLIRRQHDTHVLMDDKKFVFDLMSVSKINNNKSIEEFVLMSEAPVETAAKMSREFRVLATKEKERAKDLLAAGDYCEAMATELNAIAASFSGAGRILKSVDSRGNPFLDVLIECEQKEVVSHASVQKYLSEVWTGDLSHWSGLKMLMLFCGLLLLPPVWLVFSLPFKHRFNKVPVIKFMCYLVSHIYLIVLFTLTTVAPPVKIYESSSLVPNWYEWLLLAWLSGLLVSQLTNPDDRAGLGWIKVIILFVCCAGVFVHVLAFAFSDTARHECLYARNQFFAFSLMLCFVQLMDFLSFHHLFGPWAIIIRDLMKDLMRFLVILSIFMIGFTLNMAAIYQPVSAPVYVPDSVGDGDGAGGAPQESIIDTFELLFFALFGLVEPENLPPINRLPVWSITLAKATFGTYLIVTLIVLINLLIAMMSDTYQRIQAQSDTEWKFGRAKLFRNMNKTSATPSPLNLVTKLFTYCKILLKHKGKVCSTNAQRYVDEEEGLDTYGTDTAALDAQAQNNWLRNVVRRNTTVTPDEGFLRADAHQGPMHIEEVVDWKQVVNKYLILAGHGDDADLQSVDRLQADEDVISNDRAKEDAAPNQDGAAG